MTSTSLYGAEVIATEYEEPSAPAAEAVDAEERKALDAQRSAKLELDPFERRSSDGQGWSFAGGLAGSSHGRFDSRLTATHTFTRYFALEMAAIYSRYQTGPWSGETYGPELDAILRFANPLFVTPIAGIGVGYEQWRREGDGDVYDKAGSSTLSAFWGLDLALTKRFGIGLVRRQTAFLQARPKAYNDPSREEARLRLADSIGFRVRF